MWILFLIILYLMMKIRRYLIDKQRGLRPDISVLNYNGFGNKLCLDVTVTASLRYHVNGTPRELSIPESAQIGKQADIAFKKKMDKYDPICKANRLGFLPVIKIRRLCLSPMVFCTVNQLISFIKWRKIVQWTRVSLLKLSSIIFSRD